jgi:2-polyprenyl-6-methoxyphenol hydroxylase-like FAD-dependent oxidoreductase
VRVVVIGAGTGGLCLAHGLRRAGIDVAVYERDRTRADGLQGYRVGIDPDGSRALHRCLPPELYETFVATCARTPRYFSMLTERYRELLCLDGWDSAAPDGAVDPVDSEKSVSRMTLRQVLLTGLEETVHFDRTFERYERHPDGSVTAHFADGSSATGDLLVAADGSNSRVRRQYLPHAVLRDSGIVAVAGKLPLTAETRALLPEKVANGVSMVSDLRGYSMIVHVMRLPWDEAGAPREGIGSSDAELLARWPGLAFDNTRDYISWGFGAAARNVPADLLAMDGPGLHATVSRLTAGWHPDLRRLVALTDPAVCFPLNIRTSVPVPQWPTSTVTLIGDAIHTMTPGRGVGANTALRDAALLCRNLTAVRDGAMGLLDAVRDYETQMIGYGFEAVEKSLAQMDGDALAHRPVIGPVLMSVMRTGMRLVNHLPPVKRKMSDSQRRYRGADREPEVRTLPA